MAARAPRILIQGVPKRIWPGMHSYNKPFPGVVVSTKTGAKTVMVQVSSPREHPKYHKTVVTRKKYMCHDEHEECYEGDHVLIQKSRPYSKRKHWVIHTIVRPDPGGIYVKDHPDMDFSNLARKSRVKELQAEKRDVPLE